VTLPTFGPAHLAIVAAVPLAAAGLATWARRRPAAAAPIRVALAAGIAAVELAWTAHAWARGWIRPPEGLPLDLCDVLVWLTVFALLSPRAWALELVWFLGLAGSGMALLTPDLGPDPSAALVAAFFLAHGGVVAAALHLAWSGALRPRPGAWWRAFLWVNAYALLVAVFDAAFGTNYMYLREKPPSGTLLDLLGPWPWYVLAAEPVALLLLFLLDLPFRRVRRAPPRGLRAQS
jgi:hypothetical integral membrane protein (TIGR02206 family)